MFRSNKNHRARGLAVFLLASALAALAPAHAETTRDHSAAESENNPNIIERNAEEETPNLGEIDRNAEEETPNLGEIDWDAEEETPNLGEIDWDADEEENAEAIPVEADPNRVAENWLGFLVFAVYSLGMVFTALLTRNRQRLASLPPEILILLHAAWPLQILIAFLPSKKSSA